MSGGSVLGKLVLSHLPAELSTELVAGVIKLGNKLDGIISKLDEILEILTSIDKKLDAQNRAKQTEELILLRGIKQSLDKLVKQNTYPKNTE